MANPKRRFPIPILWIYIFAGPSFLIVLLLGDSLQRYSQTLHPGLIILIVALFVIPSVFFLLHTLCTFLEARGLLHYRHPRMTGLAAGTMLDLEMLFTGRNSQIENVRQARESLNEDAAKDSQDDIPPEKQTYRHPVA